MKTIYILHKGASLIGAYNSPNLLSEAQAHWYNDFMRRFGRAPEPSELPKIAHIFVNRMPGSGDLVIGEDQVLFGGEAN